jgi:hypothetical protein
VKPGSIQKRFRLFFAGFLLTLLTSKLLFFPSHPLNFLTSKLLFFPSHPLNFLTSKLLFFSLLSSNSATWQAVAGQVLKRHPAGVSPPPIRADRRPSSNPCGSQADLRKAGARGPSGPAGHPGV